MDVIVKCCFCRTEMYFYNSCSYEDIGLEGEGLVAVYHCPLCDAIAQFYLDTTFSGGKHESQIYRN